MKTILTSLVCVLALLVSSSSVFAADSKVLNVKKAHCEKASKPLKAKDKVTCEKKGGTWVDPTVTTTVDQATKQATDKASTEAQKVLPTAEPKSAEQPQTK